MPIPGIVSGITGAAAGGPRIVIAGQSITDVVLGGSATAILNILADGTYSGVTSAGTTNYGPWVDPTSAAALFEYQATELSGTVSTGPVGSWVTGSQDWTVTRASNGTKTCSLQIEVSRLGEHIAIKTVTFAIEATREP